MKNVRNTERMLGICIIVNFLFHNSCTVHYSSKTNNYKHWYVIHEFDR